MRSIPLCRTQLQDFGYCVVDVDGLEDAQALANGLGSIILRTEVRLDPCRQTYLCNPGPIPLHTDHPAAKYILWYCHEQDALAGSNELIDARSVIQELDPALQEDLTEVRVPCPPLFGFQPTVTHALWEPCSGSVFYAPWLLASMRSSKALDEFRRSLQPCEPHRANPKLEPRQALIVDNHRMLHGRSQLPEKSTRWLTRFWIEDSSRDFSVEGGAGVHRQRSRRAQPS